ncbi:CAS1 domain-containing protein [Echinococcus granulosus]|uniref:CAS1 domain-containing protein n=1 Tax=Echinococcus granulosus TaxID=6210 RepID=W6URG4_ECHGR|nr:CAS1 domain-containing protein [Echinococcus granulosus]EUB63281.1 CAS1 domain-containing protein [Echinococcus granulosus]
MGVLHGVARTKSGVPWSVFSNATTGFPSVLCVVSLFIWLILSAWRIWMKRRNKKLDERIVTLRQLCGCLFLMGCIVVYVAICERGIGRLVNPLFTWVGFSIITIVCIIMNSLWTHPVSKPGPMNCDLTNEIKGWMQALIVAYHYLGGYGVLPIYILMRIFVSTYVTLSGFGHFLFYWNKFSPKVFLRMNFLNISLCLSLRQPYLLHYFVGLISYCYTVVAITMTFWLALTQLFIAISKSVNEKSKIPAPLGWALQSVEGEWLARWSLDRYSSQFGLLCGFIFAQCKQRWKFTNESSTKSNSDRSYKMRTGLFFGTGIGVIAVYICYFSVTTNHSTYVKWHPYLCFIPITAIIILRNITAFGRNHASVFFSWFGAFALELFILQYHILLTRNMRKVFLVFTKSRIINGLIITPCFVTVSYWTHLLTQDICNIILPPHDFFPKPPPNLQKVPSN